MLTPVTLWVVLDLVAVQAACDPPAHRVPPAGERYEFRLLGAPSAQVGVLV
jgi:hypothetical protein